MSEELKKYKFLFDTVDMGIIYQDLQGKVIEINQAAADILGISRKELMKSNAEDLFGDAIDPDFLPLRKDEFPPHKAIHTGKAVRNYTLGIKNQQQKEWKWIKMSAVPEFKEGDKNAGTVYTIFCEVTEEKETRDNLRLYKIAVENSNNAVGMSTADGKHYYQNKAFDDLFGEIGDDPPSSLYVDEKVGREVFRTIKSGKEWKGNVAMYGKKGDQLLVSLRAYPIKNNEGKVIGLTGVHRDITEQHKAQQELLESEAILRIALEGANADSWTINIPEQEIIFSDRWAEYFGYKKNEIPRKIEDIRKIMHPDDIEKNLENLNKHLKGEAPLYESEVRIKARNGNYFWILIRGKIVEYDENRTPLRIVGTSFDITERKKARESLIESEKKLKDNIAELKAIMNALPGMVSVVDTSFTVLHANDEVVKGFDFKDLSEVIGKKCYETRKGLKNICPQCALVEAFEKKKIITRISTPEEEKMMGMATKAYAIPLFDEKGELWGGVEVIMDVTDLRNAERTITQSEKKFRHMIEHGTDCITLIDAGGKVIYESPSVKNVTGFEPEERIGKNSLDLIYAEDLPAIRKIMSAIAKTPGEGHTAQFRAIKKDGTIYWISGTVTNLLHDPNVNALVINYRDITRQKEAEEALRQSEERFRRIFEEGLFGITIAGPDFKFQNANPAFCKMLGYSVKELQKLTFADISKSDRVDEDKRLVMDLKEGRIKHIKTEKQYVRKDGTFIWGSLLSTAIRNPKGNVLYYLAMVKDISELKAAEAALQKQIEEYQSLTRQYRKQNKELQTSLDKINIINKELEAAKVKAEESDQLKTAFLANMSHEIRTPMNGILGFTDLLKQSNLSKSDHLKYLDIIEKSGYRMLNIINDLIDISKIEAGQVELENSPTSINKVLDNFHSFFMPDANRKKIELLCTKGLDDNAGIISTDEMKLGQVLSNLIKNALKYTTQGRIEFGYYRERDSLTFYVKDTGSGIDPESQKIVFDRFRQGSHDTTKTVEGSGLGLAISKAFLELMGGRIWLESELGKGSVFWFTLPYTPVSRKEQDLKIRGELEIRGRERLILVAEDDESSKIYIQEVFNKFPVKLLYATTGKEAVEIVKNTPEIDLILMDVKMPVMNGLEATVHIKKMRQDLPVIAQTAFASPLDNQKALEAGCDDYITKPLHRQLLLEIINKYLKIK